MDQSVAVGHLSKCFRVMTGHWKSSRREVRDAVTSTLNDLLDEIISVLDGEMTSVGVVENCFTSVVDSLSFSYVDAWSQVLNVLGKFYEIYGSIGMSFMSNSLVTLAELRDSEQFSLTSELDGTLKKAITSMGPRIVLSKIPLQINGNETDDMEFRRSWLLPVLRHSISHTELQYFIEYFLPLAKTCQERSAILRNHGETSAAKIYSALVTQIWALLPGFCTEPIDFVNCFKNIARTLGCNIRDRADLRLDIMLALRLLVRGHWDDANARKELVRYGPNYLPLLFNLYTTCRSKGEEHGHKMAALDTIKVYLDLCAKHYRNNVETEESNTIYKLFDKAIEKLEKEDNDSDLFDLLDLLRAMVIHVDSKRTLRVWNRIKGFLTDSKNQHQKKAYRLLEELCEQGNEECQLFVIENINELKEVLVTSLGEATASAKAPRLRFLSLIFRQLEEEQQEFMEAVIPEAILCCREINEKVRWGAFDLLLDIGKAIQRWSDDESIDNVIRRYMQMIYAGLAGSPTMVSATLLAMATITHKYKEVIPKDLLGQMIENVCLLLGSSTREVVGSCLSFVKVIIYSFPAIEGAPYLPKIIKSLCSMTDDCRRHFRIKTRDIFSRALRKFGHDVLSGLIPKSDTVMHKRIRNLRKIENRKLREKKASKESVEGNEEETRQTVTSVEQILADSESDSDDANIEEKQKFGSAWIQESNESIVDLLDPKAMHSITTTKPGSVSKAVKRKQRKDEFQFSSDGRLIINEDNDDDDEQMQVEGDDGGEDESNFIESIRDASSGKKRKLDARSSSSSVSGGTSLSKYKGGGSGIHRSLDKLSLKSNSTKYSGSEYKAKKAKGDVRKKGKLEPFAYVPLNRGQLNKRRKSLRRQRK